MTGIKVVALDLNLRGRTVVSNSIHWVYKICFFISKGFAVVSGYIFHITVPFILFTNKRNCKSQFWGSYQVGVISFTCNRNETTAKLYRTTLLNTRSIPQQRKHVAGTGNFAVIDGGTIWLMLALFSFGGGGGWKSAVFFREIYFLFYHWWHCLSWKWYKKTNVSDRNIYYQQVWIWSGLNSILGRGKKFKYFGLNTDWEALNSHKNNKAV